MKEILEEYGGLLLAVTGGGLLFRLLSTLLWDGSSAFTGLLQFWQNRGL